MKLIPNQINKVTIKDTVTCNEFVTPVCTGVHCLEMKSPMDSGLRRNDKEKGRNSKKSNRFDLRFFWQISWDEARHFDRVLLHARSWF